MSKLFFNLYAKFYLLIFCTKRISFVNLNVLDIVNVGCAFHLNISFNETQHVIKIDVTNHSK